MLRLVPPGSDEYATEGYAVAIQTRLDGWAAALCLPVRGRATAGLAAASIGFTPLNRARETAIRSKGGLDVIKRNFATTEIASGAEQFAAQWDEALKPFRRLQVAEFLIVAIEPVAQEPLTAQVTIRYDLTGELAGQPLREQRVGFWKTEWVRGADSTWSATRWESTEETVTRGAGGFIDITRSALGGSATYEAQLLHGADYWRTVLDGACGIDVYGNNGVAWGDFDGDGFDDLYICQPAGLPNRLYRNRGDGTFEDVTEKAGVGVLDNSACALFADFRNRGLQDLLVVCGGGPLLFENRGDGTFTHRPDAFRFAQAPAGTFTHAAVADYDRDGRLDIYLCVYSYYLGLDQYHYPAPYFDARNGPPNFLLRNNGDGTFADVTEKAGLHVENNRYSFACAWGETGTGGYPDLYVANDFGRANLYRNNGDGTFTEISDASRTNDAGAGMSACWADTTLDGRQDIYAANMWSAAGQRVSMQPAFHAKATEAIRAAYRQHARGNDLYRNQGNGRFTNVAESANVTMGRWSWCSDFFDFDQDGYPDLYITNGYISAPDRNNLSSFFWRQVVGHSPDDATPMPAYERGWQAINELIRSDGTWAGYQRNVALVNNCDGSFAEVSGVVGLDFPEDGRSFAVADIDHDGRLEIILKNRNAPQVRILHNAMPNAGRTIAFRLRGTRSNRDAIGAAVTVECGALRQTRTVQCGSGFLAQHTKTLLFGLGNGDVPVRASVRWPDGQVQPLGEVPAGHMVDVEEGAAQVKTTAFAATPAAYARADAPQPVEELPLQTATWLIEPLAAPAFSLPDLHGAVHSVGELRGKVALLCFWAAAAPVSLEQVRLLARHHADLAGRVAILAINVDEAARVSDARAFATRAALPFPVLFATTDVSGTYNIIYRYLFDRRRDLGIPTSFLLDADGRIVKLYQRSVEPAVLRDDAASIPTTSAERVERALPFPGAVYQSSFRRNDFTYGVAMFQHGYLDEAAASFAEVIAARPDYPEAYYNLGTLHLQRQDYAAARQNLERALKLQPNYPEAWNNLGMIAAQQGQADEAVRDFRQSLSLRPSYATALLNLGNLYRRMGNADEAQKSLMAALALQPDDAETNYSVGMMYARKNQSAKARQYLERALELRPGYAEAVNNLGVLYVREQDLAKAEAAFRGCIQANPQFDQAYLNLARLYLMQGDKRRALDVLQELLRIAPQNAAAQQMVNAVTSMP